MGRIHLRVKDKDQLCRTKGLRGVHGWKQFTPEHNHPIWWLFSVHGILQARILEWVAISYSRGSSRPRKIVSLASSALVGRFFTTETPGKPFRSDQISDSVVSDSL